MAELDESVVKKCEDRCRVKVREELYEFDRKAEELIRVLLYDKAKDAYKIEILLLEVGSNGDPKQSVLLHPICNLPPTIVLIFFNQVAIICNFDDLESCLLDIYNLCNISCLTIQHPLKYGHALFHRTYKLLFSI